MFIYIHIYIFILIFALHRRYIYIYTFTYFSQWSIKISEIHVIYVKYDQWCWWYLFRENLCGQALFIGIFTKKLCWEKKMLQNFIWRNLNWQNSFWQNFIWGTFIWRRLATPILYLLFSRFFTVACFAKHVERRNII